MERREKEWEIIRNNWEVLFALAEDKRLRTNKVQVWLLDEEKEILKQRAFEYGLSQADYLRQLIVAESIVGRNWTIDKEQGKEFLSAVNKIGSNINQIAYNTNVKRFTAYSDFLELKKDFFELLGLIGTLPFLEKEAQDEWLTHIYMLLQKQ